jgi:hypothetical protein
MTMRALTVTILVACCACNAGAQQPRASSRSVEALFAELQNPATSAKAVRSLAALGRKQSAARGYMSGHLPAAIRDSSGKVGENAMKLAGELKIKTAVPVLASHLRKLDLAGNMGLMDIATYMRLEDDPAGKALVEIGDPSVGAVADVLEQGNRQARWRASLILMSIGTPAAIQALRNHIPSEKDPGVHAFLTRYLKAPGPGPAAAAGAPASGTASSAEGEPLRLVVPGSDQVRSSLTMVSPSQSDFVALLDRYFPGITGMSSFQSLRPYLVLIRNDTAPAAVAYAVRWDVTYGNGSTQTWENYYVLRPLDQGPNVLLPPGGWRLLSPDFNVTPRQYQATGNFAELHSHPWPPVAKMVASVEGVVYGDEKYSGPEGPEVWLRLAVGRLAAHDEAVSVANLLKSGITLPDLFSTLRLQSLRGSWLHGTDAMDVYVYARGKSAQDVETLVQRDGRDRALQVLSRFAGPSARLSAFGRAY